VLRVALLTGGRANESAQGFDEWYGIPRTTDEAMRSGSAGYSPHVMPPEQIMEGAQGAEKR